MVVDRHKLAVSDTETIIDYIYFTVMLIIWAFKIKSALKTYAQMSLIWTENESILHIYFWYYIVYCNNGMESEL